MLRGMRTARLHAIVHSGKSSKSMLYGSYAMLKIDA